MPGHDDSFILPSVEQLSGLLGDDVALGVSEERGGGEVSCSLSFDGKGQRPAWPRCIESRNFFTASTTTDPFFSLKSPSKTIHH